MNSTVPIFAHLLIKTKGGKKSWSVIDWHGFPSLKKSVFVFWFSRICRSADKKEDFCSSSVEYQSWEEARCHLTLCSDESQSTLYICQNHEQLVALSSLGSALPTERCPDGFFTTTKKSDLAVPLHLSSKLNTAWILAHITMQQATI